MADGVSDPWAWGVPLSWPEALAAPRGLRLEAGTQDLGRLAHDLGLIELKSLGATLDIRPWLDGIELSGTVRGVAVRECGVTLEPFDELVDEPIRMRVVPEGSPHASHGEGEIVVDIDADDPPEEAGAAIDVTGYVTEAFALGLSPFPRKPGAEFHPPETPPLTSPFAALAVLANRKSAPEA